MRDYTFRGKTENGCWTYGSLIHVGKYCCILEDGISNYHDYPYLDPDLGTIDGYATPVIPETVGQFTGLLDKNGRRIFEGDTIQDGYGRIKDVVFFNGRYYPFIAFPEFNCWSEDDCVVIGNIHDGGKLA